MTTDPDTTRDGPGDDRARGSPPRIVSTDAASISGDPGLTPAEVQAVDTAQDEIMSRRSVDGRPPTRRQRRIGWGVALIVLPAAAIGASVWALLNGTPVTVVAGSAAVFAMVLAVMGFWVWRPGLSRGKEEAAARVEAMDRLHPDVRVIPEYNLKKAT